MTTNEKRLFELKQNFLGTVNQVDTRTVSIFVNSNEDLLKAKIGHLISIKLSSTIAKYSIAIIESIRKATKSNSGTNSEESEEGGEPDINSVKAVLVGELTIPEKTKSFTRSLSTIPEIDSRCYVIVDNTLTKFMSLLVDQTDSNVSFEIGKFSLSPTATASIEGNKFFQRHAALVGSTGTGKSWTVASILEKADKLKSSNLIVFDLHGEYQSLSYAKHIRIPGPDELEKNDPHLLFLPYWVMNAEELQTMFIDRSEFTAHNQVMAFQDAVILKKRELLEKLKKTEILDNFTIDSPIPFNLTDVMDLLRDLNEEMIEGSRGLKQGTFFGQFSRLLVRMRSKISDRRYGFLFQAPAESKKYTYMGKIVQKLMDFTDEHSQIKIIDFSEVPEDILPIIVGLVARIIYQIQFWTSADERHPIVFVCDEAHLYISKKEGLNPIEKRAVEIFEKIAKEGRKYGVALFIISQRPSDVSESILSQCNNIISLRLANNTDQLAVKRFMPESLEGLMDSLPILDIGEAIVVGDSILLPSKIRIDKPTQEPLSSTIDIWTEWSKDQSRPDYQKIVENLRKQSRK